MLSKMSSIVKQAFDSCSSVDRDWRDASYERKLNWTASGLANSYYN